MDIKQLYSRIRQFIDRGDNHAVERAIAEYRHLITEPTCETTRRTLMHIAAEECNVFLVECILAYSNIGASMNEPITFCTRRIVNARDSYGDSPLYVAVACAAFQPEASLDYLKIIKLLICHGADPMAANESGRTPLHAAVSQFSIISMVMRECSAVNIGAADNIGGSIINLEIRDTMGRTPLHCAVLCSSTGVIKYLLDCGVNINAADVNGMTPLHYAAGIKNAEITKYLILRGARSMRDATGRTQRDFAIYCGGGHELVAALEFISAADDIDALERGFDGMKF